ncbi:MAG TPA: phosphatase domain-containing protein, partial [Cytophagales bacterium]
MAHFFRRIGKVLQRLAVRLDRSRYNIKKRFGWLRSPIILPYRGFGNRHEIYLKGRVLEDNGLAKPAERNSIWHNIVAMYKRYVSNEIPNVRVKATFNGQEQVVTTNEIGFFEVRFHFATPLPVQKDWVEVQLELLDQVVPNQKQVRAGGPVMLSQEHHQFGIISDVDDTILVSNATNFYKKIKLMLFKNARSRLPFEGVASFYSALQKGRGGSAFNPVFYVSSSSWNLYDLLVDFCNFQGIPRGPFMLRGSRLDQFTFFASIHKEHKMAKIRQILTSFCDLRFILIGDSGQKDAEIYSQVVRDFPGRILAVYIRDVSNEERDAAVHAIAAAVRQSGVEMLLVRDTGEAARHAQMRGFIAPEKVTQV